MRTSDSEGNVVRAGWKNNAGVWLSLLAVVATGCVAVAAQEVSPAAGKPNSVFVLTDDQNPEEPAPF